jgi:peptide/histidine transporter 3/4
MLVKPSQNAVLCVAVALASLGLGGTRLTTATMGADQFDKPNNQVTFFSWYFLTLYVAITICQLHRHRLYSGQC